MSENSSKWRFDRRLSLGVLVQVVLLASLIVGSWMNIQRQLDLLQHDLKSLIDSQKTFQGRIDELRDKCIAHEYRLSALEKSREFEKNKQ